MGAIEVVDELSRLDAGDEPLCLVLESGDRTEIARVMQRLGLGDVEGVLPTAHGHPNVKQRDGAVLVSLFGVTRPSGVEPWLFVALPHALVVIGEGGARDEIVASVEEIDSTDTLVGLAAAVVGLTRAIAGTLQTFAETTADLEPSGRAFSRADERSTLRTLRTNLFALQELFMTQAQLLDVDEELFALTPEEGHPMLKRAHAMFSVGRSTTARLYALAGDLISEQSTLVNERLTLVSTVFLPMTVSTGFFGMNFSWMTDRVGSATAFVVLGILVPLVSVLLTLAVVRRFGAGSD